MRSLVTATLVGREHKASALKAALDAGRHVLVEGPHGVGKSHLIADYCRTAGSVPLVLHGSAGLTVAGLAGSHDPSTVLRQGYRSGSFLPGPLPEAMTTGCVLYLDEVNRVSPDVLNVLITAMSEGELTLPRYGRVVAAPEFRVVASLNPVDTVGTGSLPAAFLDRVVRLVLGYQSAAEELEIIRSQTPGAEDDLRARALFVARASRRHRDVRIGSSVRGAVDLVVIAGELHKMGVDGPGLEAALLALSCKIQLRPGVERTVESVIRDLWMDALLVEHKARGSAAGPAGVHPLPESSVQVDQEGIDDGGSTALEASDSNDTTARGAQSMPDLPSGGGHAGAARRENPGGDTSDVPAETLRALRSFVKSSTLTAAKVKPRTDTVDLEEPDLERIAAGIVIRRTRGRLPAASRQGGRYSTVRYNFRSDDLDIDRTVSALLDTPTPTHAELWVRDRVPRRLGVALMLDVSGSMRGSRAIESATAAAAAAYAAGQDELAIVAFGDHIEIVKHAAERVHPSEVVRRVLSLRPRGLTNLSAGLDAGREQLGLMKSPAKVAVIMTDGVQNEGSDPSLSATLFHRLNVLATTDSPWRLRHCRALATAGHGQCLGYESLDHLPPVLSTLLTV